MLFAGLCCTPLDVSRSRTHGFRAKTVVADRAPKNGARTNPEPLVLFTRARARLGLSPTQRALKFRKTAHNIINHADFNKSFNFATLI
jgi:hypothetical protein